MTEKEKMLSGKLYDSTDAQLKKERKHARELTDMFNMPGTPRKQRKNLLTELLGSTKENFFIEPTFKCDYGYNIHVGENFYANFDCIILDVNEVIIGDNVMFAPRVCIYTATHPVDADERNEGLEYGLKVTIKDNVWVGGNSVILPGVTIGQNAVIGAGSIVTKDVPDNAVVAGNPAKVIKMLK